MRVHVPVLPVEYRQLTLDAMRNHECRGVHDGNWAGIGEAIIEGIADLGLTQQELAEHLRALWPGGDADEQNRPRGTEAN